MLVVVVALAGTAGLPEVLLAVAVGALAGAALLVRSARRTGGPRPAASPRRLREAGVDVGRPPPRAGRRRAGAAVPATSPTAGPRFVKVYAQDSRDADLLYRGYRTLLLREPGDDGGRRRSAADVEHEALLLLLAHRAVCAARRRAVGGAPRRLDGAGHGGRRRAALDALTPTRSTPDCSTPCGARCDALHAAGLAHGALRAANMLVAGEPSRRSSTWAPAGVGGPRACRRSTGPSCSASLAVLVGPGGRSRRRPGCSTPPTWPRRCRTSNRSPCPRRLAGGLEVAARRAARGVADATGRRREPLERLVRVRPRTLLMIATLTGAFYLLLPQLANVDDSFAALRAANWAWLAGCVAMSGLTYVAAGRHDGRRAASPAVRADRRGPVGVVVRQPGDAGQRRRDGAERPLHAEGRCRAGRGGHRDRASTSLAGGIVHIVLLLVFFAWAGRGSAGGFSLPSSSKLLVVIAVVLAVARLVLATRRGRRLMRAHVLPRPEAVPGRHRRRWPGRRPAAGAVRRLGPA